MGPREALQLFASYYRSPDEPERLIALLGLATVARTPWRRLSGGEQQRLSLGLALVGRPRALFLDEPTSGVDPEGRQVMRQVIGDLRENGACVLLTTHELEEAGRLADRLIVIDRGRVVAAGTQDELAALAGHAEVRWSTTPALEIAALQAELGARVWEERPGEYVAAVTGTPTVVAAIANWLADNRLPLAAMRAGRPALEDVYLRLTKGAGAQDEAGAQKDQGAKKDHGAQKDKGAQKDHGAQK
jgi:ABC-2 type transport system ATP-binding protein